MNSARQRLDDLIQHREARATALSATADRRQLLTTTIRQINGALVQTLPECVLQLALRPSAFHVDILGAVPGDPAGRAVWCHQASELERHGDRMGHDQVAWRRLVEELADTPGLAEVARRHIPIRSLSTDQEAWRQVTERAIDIRNSIVEGSPGLELRSTRTEAGIEL